MKTTTKDKIISAAVGILEELGIQALSQLAVAKKVGISQGQLTYHFPKRSDLILAATDVALNRLAESVFSESNSSDSKDISELIWKLIHNHSRIRAQLGLVIEADQSSELHQKLLLQEERVRALIAFGIGVEADDPLVTFTHSTLLGFGVISFVRGKNSGTLHKDYQYFIQQLQQIIKTKKSKKKANLK